MQGAALCSVVANDVEPYSVVAGNPARRIRDRFDEAQLASHRQALLDTGF